MTDHDPLDPHGDSDGGTGDHDGHEREIVDPTDVELVDGGSDDALATPPELGALRADLGDGGLDAWQDDLDADLDADLELDLDADPDDLLDLLPDDGSDSAALDDLDLDDLDLDSEAFDAERPDADPDGRDPDDPTPDHGVFEPSAIVAWAADGAVAGVDREAFDLAVASLQLDPLDLDGRQTVHVLDHLGVDARVEHGSIDDLVDRLGRGARLEIVSGDERFAVTRVDDLRDTMVLRANGTGAIVEVGLDRFEAGWAATAYEMIVAEGAASSTLIAVDLTANGEVS